MKRTNVTKGKVGRRTITFQRAPNANRKCVREPEMTSRDSIKVSALGEMERRSF